MLPCIGDLVPSACAFLHERSRAVDVALRLESCRCGKARGPAWDGRVAEDAHNLHSGVSQAGVLPGL